ncbi:ACD_01940 [African swine fever virus]|uniref:ACD_01940 n=1 Tax=African swine fever virus TaxID=10497 RepID=A0A385KN35_ASF|nr:ACD_01940 [African swine fever virus]AXZ96211.1 ACD_01940 [African swine fever virus]WOB19904.1 ACD_01940 [African swine fever virus]WOB19915.1 ACD_01940 [African swine fever virus]
MTYFKYQISMVISKNLEKTLNFRSVTYDSNTNFNN